MNIEDILTEMRNTEEISYRTLVNYRTDLQQYELFHNMTIQELLDEADKEEDEKIRMKHRHIKKRLISFREEYKSKVLNSTLNKKIQRLQKVYRFYEIEVPKIPQLKETHIETVEDIPTAEHIKQAINSITSSRSKAIILLQATSGCGISEVNSITIQDFINATSQYHDETQIEKVIQILTKKEHIIPTFNIIRKKTQKPYITFCTPETTKFILKALQERLFKKEIHPEEPLFDIQKKSIMAIYTRINDKNGWGIKNNQRFFRSHSMRKFFRTTLYKNKVDYITSEFLLGHAIGKTQEAYIKVDPNALKLEYMNIIHDLTFFGNIQYNDIISDEKKELNDLRIKSKEQDKRIRQLEKILLRRPK